MNLSDLRTDYTLKSFNEKDVIQNPFDQFKLWFNDALEAKVNEPNAMTVATIKSDGSPSARILLFKELENEAFVFYSNYLSNKANEISFDNRVALVFFWPELQRQIRIEGKAEKIEAHKSDEYFLSRPRGSQIGAYASEQSKPLENSEELEQKMKHFEEVFSKIEITRPENWGGYAVKPSSFEFWQGRANRLHDRFLFSLNSESNWIIQRLSP